jgi:hypothetical protein
VKYDKLLARNAMSPPHPIGKGLAAYDDTMGTTLADKVRCPKLPRIEIQVALFKTYSQRNSGFPCTVEPQEPTPSEMSFNHLWAMLPKQLL